MSERLLIIGIDSLDPYVISKYRQYLSTFSMLLKESPTFVSESVFPVDSIPAWMSIFTGLTPGNHGALYSFDVFDPNLSDLRKVNTENIKGRTFWDYSSDAGYRNIVIFPLLMYPPWKINGIMVSKSPFEKRTNELITEVSVRVFPADIRDIYSIPEKINSLWGGYPGEKNLKLWAELGKKTLNTEAEIAYRIYTNEKWDVFFVYFNILDIIQHRLWRFFDENDPLYPGDTPLKGTILEYYKLFDSIVAKFINQYPDTPTIILSDHGHKSRPIKTVNLNEYLRKKGFLIPAKKKTMVGNIQIKIRNVILDLISRLNLEHAVIRIVSKHSTVTKISKSIYSGANLVDTNKSIAYLSNFAGIKSYPHGGIIINKEIISQKEYELIRNKIIEELIKLKTPNEEFLFQWVKKREEVYPGKFTEKIYPDILFKLREDFGVGWELYSSLFGESKDHKVASGGHAPEGVFLIRNANKQVLKKKVNVIDIAPAILDLLDIEVRGKKFDGKSIFK